MHDEPPMNDLGPIWKNQDVHGESIPAQQLRNRAHKLQKRARRDAVIQFAIALVCLLIFGRLALHTVISADWFGFAGWALATVSTMYMVVQQFRVLKTAWATNLSPDAATKTCFDFYRSTLQQNLERMRRATYAALPLILSIQILVVGSVIRERANPYFVPPIEAVLPFCLIMVVWAAWFFYGRSRSARRIRAEIASLDAFEKDVS